MPTISTVADNSLILTDWGNDVATTLNSEVLKKTGGTISGDLTVSGATTHTGATTFNGTVAANNHIALQDAPTNVNHATRMDYVDTQVGTRVATTGDTMTGTLTSSAALALNGASALQLGSGSAERARINATGLLVGKTATNINTDGCEAHTDGELWSTIATDTANLQLTHISAANANGNLYATFRLSTGAIGTITQVGTSGVAYNTTSDYRLKNVLGQITEALDRVKALQPRRLAFKSDPGVEFDGFLAHEVDAVVPYAVTGDKDAVLPQDDPHNPGAIDPQQLDSGKLVPLLVAAVQELTARVEALEAA